MSKKLLNLKLADEAGEQTIRLYDRLEVPEIRQETEGKSWFIEKSTGFLHCRFRASNAGVLTYPEHDGIKVYTSEAVQKAAMMSLSSRPVTLMHPEHPTEGPWVDVTNIKKEDRGTVKGDMLEFVNGGIEGWMIVEDKQLIDLLKNKKIKELSLGQDAVLRQEPGIDKDREYTHVTVSLDYNHLAVVPEGRAKEAGEVTKVLIDNKPKGGNPVLKKIMLKALQTVAVMGADGKTKLADAKNLGQQEYSIKLADDDAEGAANLEVIEKRYGEAVEIAETATTRVAEQAVEISALQQENKRLSDEMATKVSQDEVEKMATEQVLMKQLHVIYGKKVKLADNANHDEKRLAYVKAIDENTAVMVENVKEDPKLHARLLDMAWETTTKQVAKRLADSEVDSAIKNLPNADDFHPPEGGSLYDQNPAQF